MTSTPTDSGQRTGVYCGHPRPEIPGVRCPKRAGLNYPLSAMLLLVCTLFVVGNTLSLPVGVANSAASQEIGM